MSIFAKVIFLFISFSASLLYADNNDNISKDFSREFSNIEAGLKDNKLAADEKKRVTDILRKIKSNAKDNIQKAENIIANQKDLLSALGPSPDLENPDGGATEETAEIKQQRNKILNHIKKIDGERKTSQLNIAKADELLNKILKIEQTKIKNILFKYHPILYHPKNLLDTSSQIKDFTFIQRSSLFWSIFSIIILGLGGGCYFASIKIKHYFEENDIPKQGRICRRLFFFITSSIIIIGLQYHLFNFDNDGLLRASIQLIFGICLAICILQTLKIFRININPNHSKKYRAIQRRIIRVIYYTSIFAIIISIIGYTELSSFILLNILGGMFSLSFFLLMRTLITEAGSLMKRHKKKNNTENATEISAMVILFVEPLIALCSVGIMLFFWGITPQDVSIWLGEYKNGIPIGDLFIDFNELGASIFLFTTIILITKLLKWFIDQRVFKYTNLDIGLQNIIITVIGYIGIIFAILSSFGVLGVNMENFAIVAGALSVGIGFGLQTIFNNFVSGLILLFERPIKVGDWVTVGGHQGIVKKIKVRSTELETFSNNSLILPNSLMISEAVSNWTLHNKIGRVDISVGVAYGSDTELVRKILLQCGNSHKSVCTYPPANALFVDFGDSSLDFELRCFLVNIGDRFSVSSDIRFAIDKAFREHDIEIPFPQRDLHIKSPIQANKKDDKMDDIS